MSWRVGFGKAIWEFLVRDYRGWSGYCAVDSRLFKKCLLVSVAICMLPGGMAVWRP